MARLIPVGGEPQEERPLFDLLLRFANNGRRVDFLHLEGEQTIASHPDEKEVNKIASQFANGTTIQDGGDGTVYGDAIIFHNSERGG